MTERIMGPGRLEAFSDGVIAVIITIMVLELKVPASRDPAALLALWPTFLSYVLSYLVVAIYWVNQQRQFHQCRRVDNAVLWSNMLYLFCISLIPFATAYLGQDGFTSFSTALYGASMLLANVGTVPLRIVLRRQLKDEPEFAVMNRRAALKGYVSMALYAASIPLAYVHPALTLLLCFVVAAMYFLPNAWLSESG